MYNAIKITKSGKITIHGKKLYIYYAGMVRTDL